MKKLDKKSRRQFLRNTSLSFISLSALANIANAFPVSRLLSKKDVSCNQSTEDAYGQGPFYTVNAPFIQNSQLAVQNEPGMRMIISGRVYNLDCTEVISNTEIDVWHANDAGTYDNLGYNLRGKVITNSQGFYIFESIKPGYYLNGPTYRPSHIHFKITPPGFAPLITQLYFQDDPYIPTDAAASITSGLFDASSRIIPLNTNSNGVLEGNWDIVIDGDGVSLGASNIHLNKGMIYSANPIPFTDHLEINYGVFQKAKVGLSVYDIQGQLIANLDERILEPAKYYVSWNPHASLPRGHYFVAILINDLQVHYIKILKQ